MVRRSLDFWKRNVWLGQDQPSPLVVLLFSSWSLDSQGMNLQSLYPGLGGPSASCLKKTGVDAHILVDLKATLLEKRALLHCWWNVSWNVSWCCLCEKQYAVSSKKLKTEQPYEPAIPLLGLDPDKTIIQKDTHTSVFDGSIVKDLPAMQETQELRV